jgi:hydroxyethylthiazole kinase-like uncharacterized protein yjeF
MLVTCEEMKRAEEEAFARGISAEALMERAGRGIAEIVRQFYPVPGTCIAVCGKGHNGGDALVAARILAGWGWNVEIDCVFSSLAPLSAKKRAELPSMLACDPPSGSVVVLDGLLGIGARGEPHGKIADAVRSINSLRRNGAWVLAIDLPSGLHGDSGRPSSVCVEADLTATIAAVKQGLVADAATGVVGRLAVVPLPDLAVPKGVWKVSLASEIRSWLPPRSFDTHKGQAGRVGIVAGSPGFLGAARLCSAAAVKAGGGLVTLFARPETAPLLATCCLPEVMVKTVSSYHEVLDSQLDVLAVGPGLGLTHAEEILTLLREAPQPAVVDADALNALSTNLSILKNGKAQRLLTPHPGEMERLFPQDGRSRRRWLDDFLAAHPATLLLKGARTLLGAPGGARYINPTGNPGMASGGMGDVLTGVCAALIGQHPAGPLLPAAVLGAWLCGRAAERAVAAASPESLRASDVLSCLGSAFTDLRQGAW